MKKGNKMVALVLALLMVSSIFAACTKKEVAPEPAVEPSKEAVTQSKTEVPAESKIETSTVEGVTITLAASQNWIKDIDREIAEEFKAETGHTIDFQLSPDDQYQTIVKSKLNTGEGPDIFMSYSGTKLRDFNPETNMADLSAEPWAGKLKEWAVSGSSYNGVLYAQNLSSVDGTNGVLYQPAMFEQYGLSVPTTYAEFQVVCDTLLANGITPVNEFVKDLWHTHYWVEGVAAQAAVKNPKLIEQLNKNEIGFADVPEFVTAMEQVKEMADSNYFGENHMSNTYDKSYQSIGSGESAMIIIHSSYPNELLDNVDGVNPDDFRMFPNPLADNTGITLTAGGTVRCISAHSPNVDAAKEYLAFLARPEIAQRIYDARLDYMEPSMTGLTGNPTKANEDISAVANRILGPEAAVYFYDGGKLSELMQEMFVGSLSPTQALEEFDTHRRSIAKDAGLEGF